MSGERANHILAASAAMSPEMLLGAMFVTALIGGYVARLAHAPRILGYLLGGLALKYLLAWTALRSSAADWSAAVHGAGEAVRGLSPLSDLALGMILFTLGTAFDAKHLRAMRTYIWKLTLAESGSTFVLVCVGCTLVVGVTGAGWGDAVALGLLLGAAAVATAPATTLLVLNEYGSKGPTTDSILGLTGLNCLWSIVAFHVLYVILATAGVLPAGAASPTPVWVDLVLVTGGSAALGLLLGLLLSWLTSARPLAETLLLFFAAMLVLSTGGQALRDAIGLSFSFLLACLFAGIVFANVAVNPERFEATLRTIGAPVYAAFFVLAGYQLHLDLLARLGLLGIAYAMLRVVGKIGGIKAGVHWAGSDDSINPLLGTGLLAQAGVAIGLANFMMANCVVTAGGTVTPTALAGAFYATILGSVAVFEMVGPLATKWIAVRSGEVKAIYLMRRGERATASGSSVARMLVESLLRVGGLRGGSSPASDKPLCVNDIMRTNVKCLSASHSFDEVLHFVEHSRFNDFPVVDDDNRLVGVIHFADIRELTYDSTTRHLITAVDLADISTPPALRGQPLTDLFKVFEKVDVGALPVIESAESRKVVGLVEQRDLLRALHKRPGERSAGSH